ncbi:hypothetical protein EVJ58_g1667 [Rhodofomes roseus]|uniref:FAD binding domain-containing protein n=1 Tax=Rhodofomes roseus TaxID=34475 RepID=A0A4Y9Z1Y6_9APHY|nr:hypothetical protein EVJ58_g1667 [Rhodofomes roseus]
MPHQRAGGVSIESAEHGNVLWTPQDNGRTRIGFVCPDHLWDDVTAEALIQEARKALHPFTLKIEKLDWWTVYAVGQRVAETYRSGPVFLAGDAAHTHSSAVAQGMNTGWLHEDVLATYDAERRPTAERVIQLDRDIASLISGVIPCHFNAPRDADPNAYLEQVLLNNASFTVGLGIAYEENALNLRRAARATKTSELVGRRAPDAALYRPFAILPCKLYSCMPYIGKFWILVFAGRMEPGPPGGRLEPTCSAAYRDLKECLDGPQSFLHTLAPVFNFLTIPFGTGALQSAEALGEQPLGKTVYDHTGEAYTRYGIDALEGAIVVVRPDSMIGTETSLGADGYDDLHRYFVGVVCSWTKHASIAAQGDTRAVGEILLDDELETIRVVRTAAQ